MFRRCAAGAVFVALAVAACGGGAAPSDAGGIDASGTDAAGTDSGTSPDGAGCVDEDSDGHGATTCGGDDCDDHDPLRYPGRPETCDAAGHDDDCDPATLGPDADHDGFSADACCNTQPSGALVCGQDCDDTRITVSPTAVETCNGVDENCNGTIDEMACMACAGSTVLATPFTRKPVDIVFVVDSSTSMRPAIDQVNAGLNGFASTIDARGIDYRVMMLSARGTGMFVLNGATVYGTCIPMPLAGDTSCGDGPRFFHESIPIRSVQPIEQLLGTLDETTGYTPGASSGAASGETSWGTHLRAGATKTFVLITDDNQRVPLGTTVTDFFEHFAGGPNPFVGTRTLPAGILEPSRSGMFDGYKLDALYGWGSATDPAVACTYSDGTMPSSSGPSYTELVAHTGGARAKICDGAAAWDPFFDDVATAVIAGARLECETPIPAPPPGMVLDPARVNVQLVGASGTTDLPRAADLASCGTARGWYYDDPTSPTRVLLCPAACDFAQTELDAPSAGLYVQFGCVSVFL